MDTSSTTARCGRLPLAAALIGAVLTGTTPAQAAFSFRDSPPCPDAGGSVSSLTDAVTCGSVSGSARMLYYTTHNAYFSKDFNQDTVSYGGFVKYETAPLYGFNLGVSAIFQRGIRHPDRAHVINDIADNLTNVGEAYLGWRYRDLHITAGNQRLTLPFLGDYDFRITPMLYQAVDVLYGAGDDFLRATKVWRYKGFNSGHVQRSTNYFDDIERTNGMWALGAGHHLQWQDKKLTGQMWYESYNDISNIFYTEGHISWQQAPLTPDFGLQFLHGSSNGRALLGEANSHSYGAQLSLALTRSLNWSLGYDHIAASGNSYGYGSMITPYAHNASSGPYFAQPYFTSTQDLGSGNAWASNLNWLVSPNLTLGGRYSWMDLTPMVNGASRRQSEYLAFAIWKFHGALEGLSLSDFFGVQTSPLYDSNFWQNRLTLQYNF